MSSTTREALKSLPRPFRAVELPGGATVHVRDVSLKELERIDQRAEELPEGPDRNVRWNLLLCAYALAEADGSPCFTYASPEREALDALAELTPSQISAIASAAVPGKGDAKN